MLLFSKVFYKPKDVCCLCQGCFLFLTPHKKYPLSLLEILISSNIMPQMAECRHQKWAKDIKKHFTKKKCTWPMKKNLVLLITIKMQIEWWFVFFSCQTVQQFVSIIVLNVGESWMRQTVLWSIGENRVAEHFWGAHWPPISGPSRRPRSFWPSISLLGACDRELAGPKYLFSLSSLRKKIS